MAEHPLDKIYVRDLVCRCIVGINPDERVKKQEVTINLVLHADLQQACQTDDINHTVDYKVIKERVLEMVEHSEFLLVEKLAEEIAAVCLEAAQVERVQVSVDKPGALRFARSVAVEITRGH